jgi:hypothetical protein
MRDYKYLAFRLILDCSNELEIDPAEILAQYDMSEDEIEDFYKWVELGYE